jgi:hypothetical protein
MSFTRFLNAIVTYIQFPSSWYMETKSIGVNSGAGTACHFEPHEFTPRFFLVAFVLLRLSSALD